MTSRNSGSTGPVDCDASALRIIDMTMEDDYDLSSEYTMRSLRITKPLPRLIQKSPYKDVPATSSCEVTATGASVPCRGHVSVRQHQLAQFLGNKVAGRRSIRVRCWFRTQSANLGFGKYYCGSFPGPGAFRPVSTHLTVCFGWGECDARGKQSSRVGDEISGRCLICARNTTLIWVVRKPPGLRVWMAESCRLCTSYEKPPVV